MWKACRSIAAIVLLAMFGLGTAVDASVYVPVRPVRAATQRVLPGEFERQSAVMLGWDDDDRNVQAALVDIIRAAAPTIPILLLVENANEEEHAIEALRQADVPRHAIRFLHLPFNTVWARDYGPTIVQCPAGHCYVIDADYERGERPQDDEVPAAIAPLLGLQIVHAPLAIEGGNLISNGAGVCVTTVKVLDSNTARGYTERQVSDLMREHYGANEVVYLEPLVGELTGHVDMFMTFTAADTVLVGAYDFHDDPINSEILDRNAERLAHVMTSAGPLKVYRVPMPPHEFETWRTYTNVLYANGTVVVPVYPGIDEEGRTTAMAIYRKLLPNWKIAEVDCSRLIHLGGAVHCVTRNLSRLPQLPRLSDGPGQLSYPVSPAGVAGRHQVGRMFEPDRAERGYSPWLAKHERELLHNNHRSQPSNVRPVLEDVPHDDRFRMPFERGSRLPSDGEPDERRRSGDASTEFGMARTVDAAQSTAVDSARWQPPLTKADAPQNRGSTIRSRDLFGSSADPFIAD